MPELSRLLDDAQRERAQNRNLLPKDSDESVLSRRKGYEQYHYVNRKGDLVKNPGTTRGLKKVRGEHASGYHAYRAPFDKGLHGERMTPYWKAAVATDAKFRSLPGDYGQTRWGMVKERTVYHKDGTTSVYRRGE